VVERVATAACRPDENGEIGAELLLADELPEPPGP